MIAGNYPLRRDFLFGRFPTQEVGGRGTPSKKPFEWVSFFQITTKIGPSENVPKSITFSHNKVCGYALIWRPGQYCAFQIEDKISGVRTQCSSDCHARLQPLSRPLFCFPFLRVLGREPATFFLELFYFIKSTLLARFIFFSVVSTQLAFRVQPKRTQVEAQY